jgi:hypothetical protein
MTTGAAPDAGGVGETPQSAGRLDNGLFALSYVPLTDVDVAVGRQLLIALGRARIAAYLAPRLGEEREAPEQRLFVNAEERADARTIVASAVRALGGPAEAAPAPRADPLAGVDTDAAFAQLIADWHVDTVAAVRDAERDLNRQDADWRARLEPPAQEPVWLDDDHYVPPPPPPLPRLAGPTILAILVLVLSVLVLGFGDTLGFTPQLTFLLGIGGLLLGAGMLVMRLRETRDEDDDDGAVL